MVACRCKIWGPLFFKKSYYINRLGFLFRFNPIFYFSFLKRLLENKSILQFFFSILQLQNKFTRAANWSQLVESRRTKRRILFITRILIFLVIFLYPLLHFLRLHSRFSRFFPFFHHPHLFLTLLNWILLFVCKN